MMEETICHALNVSIFAALTLVRCLRGRKEQFAKLSYGLICTEGSNPSLTASQVGVFGVIVL